MEKQAYVFLHEPINGLYVPRQKQSLNRAEKLWINQMWKKRAIFGSGDGIKIYELASEQVTRLLGFFVYREASTLSSLVFGIIRMLLTIVPMWMCVCVFESVCAIGGGIATDSSWYSANGHGTNINHSIQIQRWKLKIMLSYYPFRWRITTLTSVKWSEHTRATI